MALSICAAQQRLVAAKRQSAVPAMRKPVARKMIVRASAEPTEAAPSEAMVKMQAMTNEAVAWVKTKWEGTEDSEKPAVVAILISVIVAQIAIGATIDVVDRIPIVNKLLQLVGIVATATTLYKLSTDPEERDAVKDSVSGFLTKVTGDK